MTMISQRELRNDNADIMRAIERGESYTVTRRGVPVARLTPITQDSDLRIARPATSQAPFAEMRRVTVDETTSELLDDLRGDR